MLDDGIEIDTSELDGFADLLEKFPLEVQNKMVRQSVGAGAAVLMLGVMEKCPVRAAEAAGVKSTAAKPGALKADIRAVAGKTGRAWYIGAGPTMAYLMRWLERGHLLVKGGQIPWVGLDKRGRVRRRGGRGRVVGHVPAHPVLRPAFDEYWRRALHATAEELGTRIGAYWKETLARVKRAA